MRSLRLLLILVCMAVIPSAFAQDCDGTSGWWGIRRCCRKNGPCDVGQGDCNRDSECADGLQCGNNNCRRDFSTSETRWGRRHDCCFSPESPPEPEACDGTDWFGIRRCCRNNGPCNEGEGDCNRDSECAEGLICGRNNCRRDFSTDDTWWRRRHDCCISVTTTPQPTEDPNPTEPTEGTDETEDPNTTEPTEATEDPNTTEPTVATEESPEPTEPTEATEETEDPEPTAEPTETTNPTETTPPSPPLCGMKPAQIVGGSEVTPYSLPWQVAFVGRGGNSPFCGGTLISDRHVLTAAHCTSNGGNYDVIVGEHRITASSDGTRHSVCRFVDHPSYNSNSLSNDFSILHLDTPVQIGTRAAPACLPLSSFGGDFLAGKTMTVSGWGALSEGGGSPTVLHSVDVPGITNDQCNNNYPGSITNAMLCAGKTSGEVDSCQGDSGGPLTYTTGGRTYITGVVSWGAGCARPNQPGVYARVTEVMDWINGQLGQTC